MKALFEMPFVFSAYISPNEGFRSKFLEICEQKYERPKVVIINKYLRRYNPSIIYEELVDYVYENGEIKTTLSYRIENLPSDKDIAKNKKIFDMWKSTNEQLKRVTNESTQTL